ncbi:thioesterase II family protein [Pseudomonas sp. 43A]|uniref:thioesterase II family protein n=2 Tax=Pseudomonas TaxID=286 RepID=UPI00273E6902|nr:alpha/beta fold hydrolase [Pseudomonas sp. 43A]
MSSESGPTCAHFHYAPGWMSKPPPSYRRRNGKRMHSRKIQHVNLLALPCAGASANMYLRWRRLLPDWISLVPVELPGRGSRLSEPFIKNFDRLVEQICEEQAPKMRERYALFGHSMGALLAHAIVQRQRQLGNVEPNTVFASASPAPSRFFRERFVDKNNDAALIKDLRRLGGTPEAIFGNDELLRMTLDTLGADYRICESFQYQFSEPYSMPLHVFGGKADDIAAERIEAWRKEAGGEFTLDWFEGNHFFINQHEHQVVTSVVNKLKGR